MLIPIFWECPHTWAHSQNSGICFLKANLDCFPEIPSASGPYLSFDQAPGVVWTSFLSDSLPVSALYSPAQVFLGLSRLLPLDSRAVSLGAVLPSSPFLPLLYHENLTSLSISLLWILWGWSACPGPNCQSLMIQSFHLKAAYLLGRLWGGKFIQVLSKSLCSLCPPVHRPGTAYRWFRYWKWGWVGAGQCLLYQWWDGSPSAGTRDNLSSLLEAGHAKASSAVLQNALSSPKGSSDCIHVD